VRAAPPAGTPRSVRARLVQAAAAVAVAALVALEVTAPRAAAVDPTAPTAFLDAAAIARAEAFRGPLRLASVAALLLRAAAALAVLRWGARWWQARWDAERRRRRRLPAIALAAVAAWAVTDLVRLPLQVWAWRRSVEVGLSTQDLAGWARDLAVQVLPHWAGVGVVAVAAVALHDRAPRLAAPLAGLLGGVAGAALIVVSPIVLEPLLHTFTPLPPQPLRTAIAEAAAAAGVQADVLVADASRRTTASNAYVSGIAGTRRIVLYDTLLRDAPDAEVLAVVAHEIAHDRNRDVERRAAQLVGVTTLLAVAVVLLLGPRLTDGSGRIDPAGATRAVALLVMLLVLLGPVERWSSRRAEAAADATALTLTGDPAGYRDMLVGLARRGLADPDPPGWATALFASHPPTAARIGRAEAAAGPDLDLDPDQDPDR
jgi:STE24 endopeptidase